MFKRPDKEADAKAAEQSEFDRAMEAAEPAPLEAVGGDLLTPDEIDQIRKDARAKVEAEVKNARKKALMTDAVLAERVRLGLVREEDIQRDIPVTIDLAEYADRITLDFRMYMQGHTYMVSPKVAATLHEIMERTHRHQAEIEGKTRFKGRMPNIYSKQRDGRTELSAASGAITRAGNLR